MPGHQATAMHFWQLLLIISQMRGIVVSFQFVFISIQLILSSEELLINSKSYRASIQVRTWQL